MEGLQEQLKLFLQPFHIWTFIEVYEFLKRNSYTLFQASNPSTKSVEENLTQLKNY